MTAIGKRRDVETVLNHCHVITFYMGRMTSGILDFFVLKAASAINHRVYEMMLLEEDEIKLF